MQFHLISDAFIRTIQTVKRVAIMIEMLAILMLLSMGICGVFKDIATAILFPAGILLVTTSLLIPGLLYDKYCQVTVAFCSTQINVMNRSHCLRSIPYSAITDVSIEEIAGFFYGRNKSQVKDRYICFFQNNLQDIPSVPYSKLFAHKSFFIVSYRKDAFDAFQSLYSIYVTKGGGRTEDGRTLGD